MADPFLITKPQNAPLLNRANALVIIVEAGSAVRMMISEVLRGLGFEKFQSASSLKEAIHFLETEEVAWVITPLLFDQPIHALNLLKLITQTIELKNVAVSLFVSESETAYLCQAFELGALSWHPKAYAKEHIQSEMETALQHIDNHKGHMAFVAAEYIRRFLLTQKFYRSLSSMEEGLLAMRPGSSRQMLALAEAELSLGKSERGHMLLSQVKSIDESLASSIKTLETKYPAPNPNTTPIKTVVVIDPDSNHRHSLEGLLKKVEGMEPHSFENGQSAFEWIESGATNSVDLIIMEWKIPGLAGPVLLQRLRKQVKYKGIVIVVSSLLKANEKPLLKEMGVDELFEKPLDTSSFLSRLVGTMQHKAYTSRRFALETKIRRLIAAKRIDEALVDLPTLTEDPKVQDSIKRELLGEIDYYHGKYPKALALAIEALKMEGGHTLGLLNLAGKCFLKLQQFQSAIKCFEKAKELSPMNIERLFDLAESKLAIEETADAQANLQIVQDIDPTNPRLIEIQTKIDLEVGRKTSPMLEMLEPIALKRIAAFINNRGVILVRSGRFDEGIGLYERALKALPLKAVVDRSLVTYNLALAFARYGQFDPALETLNLIPSPKDSSSPAA